MEKELFRIADTNTAEHYTWGEGCDGWHFVKTDSLSVIKETMPGMSSEKPHYHQKSQQFFYILSGEATFEVNGSTLLVAPNKGIAINAGVIHRILNNSETDLEFLVVSEPKSHGDRINVDENQ